LRDLMCTPGMDQFQQRIIATCHLKPLGLRETREYIKHRLCQAGWKGDPELTGAALLAIHQWSRGVPRHINKLCNRLLLLGYGKGKHILDEEEVQAIYAELREEQLTPLGSTREAPDEFSATLPREEPGDEACSLSELALDRNSVAAENPHPPLSPAPVFRPETHAATRQSQQTAERRVHARAKARRESQPVKSSTARGSSVSSLDKVRRHYGPGLARLLACRDRLKVGMGGRRSGDRYPVHGRTGMVTRGRAYRPGTPARRQQAPIKPSMLAHGGVQEHTEIVTPQPGQHEPAPRTQAAVPDKTPEKLPGDDDRIDDSRNAAVVEAATRMRAPEKITIAATSVVDPPPVESVTPPQQVSDTTQDESEINGLEAGQDNVAMAAPDRALPDFESMDAPAAGDGADQIVSTADPPVAPPVSREEKIAALLAQGQQSLREFRLLTPPGDSANHYFKEVLALDPGNTDTRQGFNLITERYVILARRANARRDRKLARVYISRGLQVRPGNRALLALQDSMRKPPLTTRETIAKASPAVESPLQQTGFLSRLKSLFTREQGQPAKVVECSIMSVNP
jgi:hypothetical protein